MQKVHIGTSGFYYDHWIGRCYREGSPKNTLLEQYAQNFSTVELNTTFYHFPRSTSVEHWAAVTPENFCFSVKANRAITHMHRLAHAKELLQAFLHQLQPLRSKLGVILFQLPPSLSPDIPLLEAFLSELPEGYRYAFEFRDIKWLDDRLYELLSQYGVSLCINDFGAHPTPWIATAGHVYIRLHGPTGHYEGKYQGEALDTVASRMLEWAGPGRELFCYFNNDMEGFAWQNAKELIERLEARFPGS